VRRGPIDKSKALGKTAQKGVVWSFLRESVSEILLFPASMVLARLLTPREFGIAAAAAFFIQLAGRLSELGFNSALIRAKVVEPIHLSTVFVVQIVLGLVTFSTMVLLSPWIGAFYNMPEASHVLPISAIAFLITPIGSVQAAILQRNFQYKKSTTVDWAQLLVTSVTNIGMALLGFSYMSIVYARLTSLFTTQVMRIYFARWKPSLKFSWTALREMLPTGIGFFSKRLLDYAAQNGDNLVVGKIMGLGALGLYDKAYSTMQRFLVRMNTGGPGVMFRIFAVIHEEPERFRRAYTKVMMSSSMLGFPVFTALGIMSPQLMVVMFGRQWEAAALPFTLLCATAGLKLLNAYASSATNAAGRVWSEVWRQILYVVLIVTGIFLFRQWGPAGAAAGVLCATAVMSVLMHVLLQRVTHLPWGQIGRPLVPALLCAIGVAIVTEIVEYALRAMLPEPNPWLLVFTQAPAAAVWVVGFALFAPLKDLRAIVLEMADTVVPKVVKRHRWTQAYLNAQVGAAGDPAA
jgi:O-antigen/teichoic acid export membrane protein